MFLNCKKSFLIRTSQFPFCKDRVISPFFKYDVTNFRIYDPIKINVEAFNFDLRPVSSFRTMWYVFLKSKPYMKFGNAPTNSKE